jgi:hypothetical protein
LQRSGDDSDKGGCLRPGESVESVVALEHGSLGVWECPRPCEFDGLVPLGPR